MRLSDLSRRNNCAEVVGVGAATLDDLWLVENFMPNEGVQKALDHLCMGGGPVATSLCILSMLGHETALIDSCGDDAVGKEILSGLTAIGVKTNAIQCVAGAVSAQALVLVRAEDGARQISYMPSKLPEPAVGAFHADMIRAARLLHLNGRHESTARACVEIAQQSGILISYDGGSGRYRDSIRDLVLASHLRLVSKDFALHFTGCSDLAAMMSSLLSGVAKVVVITDGLKGSHIQCSGGEILHQQAYPAFKTVDTTGCGDVFHGAFLHGYLSHWDIQRCADFASRLASLNAKGLGGRHILKSDLNLITA